MCVPLAKVFDEIKFRSELGFCMSGIWLTYSFVKRLIFAKCRCCYPYSRFYLFYENMKPIFSFFFPFTYFREFFSFLFLFFFSQSGRVRESFFWNHHARAQKKISADFFPKKRNLRRAANFLLSKLPDLPVRRISTQYKTFFLPSFLSYHQLLVSIIKSA